MPEPRPVPPLAHGLWGVLATPFTGPGLAVDAESLRREVALFWRVPATGLVVLGVFGEGAALDSAEADLVVRTVADEAPAAPLVVGLSARSTAVALEQARTACRAAGDGLAALMVQVNSPEPDVLVRHLTALHDTTGAGIVLQDYPETSGVRIGSAQVLATLERCPFVVAVKSEAPPTAAAIGELTARTDVPVFGGLGGVGLLDELAAGAAGAMTGFSHPEGLRAALDAWQDGGYAAARAAFLPWLPLVNFEAQPRIGLALRKEILRRRGLFADGAVRPPAPGVPPRLLEQMTVHLDAVDAREVA
ncbi:MAG TPA: dihydrodipicolinate synthase family protein [Nocardioidaceae bacterium]|nr:dihydrodipicolinate synthase family protein [Nocardioidaceae bacterium]